MEMKEITEEEKLSWIERQSRLAMERMKAKESPTDLTSPSLPIERIAKEFAAPCSTVYGFTDEVHIGKALVKAAHGLNIHELRLIRYAVAQIHPTAPQPTQLFIKIAAIEYAEAMEVKESKHFYRDIEKAAEGLWDKKIRTYKDTPKGQEIETIGWLSHSKYYRGEGVVELRFTAEVTPYLSMLSNGNKIIYRLQNLVDLKSVYSVRLYELIMQWQDTKRLLITVDDLRHALEVPEKYTFGVMKVNCIDHAVSELKKLGKVDVKYTAIKDKTNKRKIGSLEFTWKPVEQIEMPLEGGETPKKARGRKPKEA